MQCLCHGQRNGAAHAAADYADIFQAFDLGCLAKRADKVMHGLALFEGVQLHRTCAHDLKDDRNGASFAVKSGDSQGDALGILLRTDNDELAGLRLFGDERRMDPELGHGGVELPPFDDSKQSDLSFSLLFYKVGAYIVAYFPGNVKKKVKTNKQEKTGKRDMAVSFGGVRAPRPTQGFLSGVVGRPALWPPWPFAMAAMSVGGEPYSGKTKKRDGHCPVSFF